jgi:hypothetical protein
MTTRTRKEKAIEIGALALAKNYASGWHMHGTITPTSTHFNTARIIVDALFEDSELMVDGDDFID